MKAAVPSSDSPKPVLRRLMLPLAAMLILLLVGAGTLLWQQHQQRIADNVANRISEVRHVLRNALDHQAIGLAAAAQPIATDVNVQKALRKGNVDALLTAWRPLFEALRRQNNVTHFYFFDKNRVCLLRLHAPEKRGDLINRFTALEAERTGKTASGIELGPLGTFTLRVVQPVFENGRLVGYVELGKEVEEVLKTVYDRADLELVATIRKENLNRQAWEESMHLLGRDAEWDRLPNNIVIYVSPGRMHVVIYASGRLPDAFAPIVDHISVPGHAHGEADHGIAFDGKDWRISATPLLDVSGKEVGDLMVMRDISDENAAFTRLLALGGTAGAALLALLLGFVYLLLGRTDAGIRAQQAALRESEQSYRNQFYNNLAVMLLIDPNDGKIIDANAAALGFYGYHREQMLTLRITDVNNLHASEVRQAMESIPQGEGKRFNFQHRLADGSVRDVEVSSSAIQFGERTVLHSIIQDVTERKRGEKEMAIISDIGRLIGSTLNIDDVYQRFAEETRKLIPFDRITVNLHEPHQETMKIAYVSGEEFPGRKRGDLFPMKGSVSETLVRTRAGIISNPKSVEEMSKQFPGSIATVQAGMRSVMGVPLFSRNEVIASLHFRSKKPNAYTEQDLRLAEKIGMQIAGAIANAQLFNDVTKTEKSLRKSEELYRTLVEHASDMVFRTDENGCFTFVNSAVPRITRYKEEELIGKLYTVLIRPDMRDTALKFFDGQLAEGLPNTYSEYPIITKEGREVWVGQNTQFVMEDGRVSRQVVARDITERKKMEAEILALSITDPLTGLQNRRGFLSLAGQQLKVAERNKTGMLLFFADLDGLKWINDTLGHEEGDKALIEVATVLKETFRTSDIIARLGGDEYAVLAGNIAEVNAVIINTRLRTLIETQNNRQNRKYRLSISVGYSRYDPENPCSIEELIASADKLMYEQKQKTKGHTV